MQRQIRPRKVTAEFSTTSIFQQLRGSANIWVAKRLSCILILKRGSSGRSNLVGQKLQSHLVWTSSFPRAAKFFRTVTGSIWCHSTEHSKFYKCVKFQPDRTKGARLLQETCQKFQYKIFPENQVFLWSHFFFCHCPGTIWCHSIEHSKFYKCAKFQRDPTKGVRELIKMSQCHNVTKQDKYYI